MIDQSVQPTFFYQILKHGERKKEDDRLGATAFLNFV
jgi:hypothetical protein